MKLWWKVNQASDPNLPPDVRILHQQITGIVSMRLEADVLCVNSFSRFTSPHLTSPHALDLDACCLRGSGCCAAFMRKRHPCGTSYCRLKLVTDSRWRARSGTRFRSHHADSPSRRARKRERAGLTGKSIKALERDNRSGKYAGRKEQQSRGTRGAAHE